MCADGLDLKTTRVAYYRWLHREMLYICVHTGSHTHLYFLALSAERALEVMTCQ